MPAGDFFSPAAPLFPFSARAEAAGHLRVVWCRAHQTGAVARVLFDKSLLPPGTPGLVPVLQSKNRRNGGDSPVAAVHFIFRWFPAPVPGQGRCHPDGTPSASAPIVPLGACPAEAGAALPAGHPPVFRPRLPGLCLCQIAAQQVALGEGPAHGHTHDVFGVVVGKEAAAAVKSSIPIRIFYSLLTW